MFGDMQAGDDRLRLIREAFEKRDSVRFGDAKPLLSARLQHTVIEVHALRVKTVLREQVDPFAPAATEIDRRRMMLN